MEEVRRADDDELLGYVVDADGSWQALTVFHGRLAVRDGRAEAEEVVRSRGLVSMSDRWYYRAAPDADWQVVVLQEAQPGRVRLALGRYSERGVPTVVVTAEDLAEGASLTLDEPPRAGLDAAVERALRLHDITCDVLACDPEMADTAEFCAHYGFSLDQAANTILAASKKVEPTRFAVCVLLGTTRLDVNHRLSNLMGVKRLSFADGATTQELTGMMIGGVTPFGIEDLPIYVDSAVIEQDRVVVGGGNRSSKVLLDPRELLKLPTVQVVDRLAVPRSDG